MKCELCGSTKKLARIFNHPDKYRCEPCRSKASNFSLNTPKKQKAWNEYAKKKNSSIARKYA